MEMETITLAAEKPFNNVNEYKSHKNKKKSRKKKRPANSLARMLEREKALKNIKKVTRNFDIEKERDSLISDMTEYQKYATGRVINLTMLKDMINGDGSYELSEQSRATIVTINELLDIYNNNLKEVKTSIDICNRLSNKSDTVDALEATMHLSSEIVEIMQAASDLEEKVVAVIEPYKNELKQYIIDTFSNSMNAKQAEDVLDVDNNAEEDNVTFINDEENSNGSETKETEESIGK